MPARTPLPALILAPREVIRLPRLGHRPNGAVPCNLVCVATDGGNVAEHQVKSELAHVMRPEGKLLDGRNI